MRFLEELASRRRFGMRPGLATITALCGRLGDPQRRFRAIHVAGTNGKGAVTALLDAALRHGGLRIGRYTSPHLVRLNERFFLSGAPVDDATLERHAEAVAAVAGEITFFEALTAVAFRLYAEAGVDYGILECGLGGRLDATNICDPELSVITRIGLDHCDWLGDTEEKIAAEKAGIVRPGVPVVLGRNSDAVREVVSARARELGSPFCYAPDLADDSELPARLPLAGSFNRENAQTALAALKVLVRGDGAARGMDLKRLVEGFAETVWPGRFQRIGRFLVDGAHNPPAARALSAAIGPADRYTLIAGFCGDKDVTATLRILAPHVERAYAVRTGNPRSLTAAETAVRMREAGIPAETADSLAEAIAATSGPTLICGSLFLAGEAIVELGAYPWGPVRHDPSECLRPAGFDIISR